MIFGWDVIKHVLKLLESGGSQTLQSTTIVEVNGLSVRFESVMFLFHFRGLRQLLQTLVP